MRIFVAPLRSPASSSSRGDEHHYLARVRRAPRRRCGRARRRRRLARAARRSSRSREAETALARRRASRRSPMRCRACARCVPLIKGDRMDTCLEKLVEVGVDEIVVWPAARAVVKLDGERRDDAHRAATRRRCRPPRASPAARRSRRSRAADSLAAAIAALPAGTRLVLDPVGRARRAADRRRHHDRSAAPRAASHRPSSTRSRPRLRSRWGSGRACCAPRRRPMIAVALIRAATQS